MEALPLPAGLHLRYLAPPLPLSTCGGPSPFPGVAGCCVFTSATLSWTPAGATLLVPFVPTLMTNYFASERAGRSLHCEEVSDKVSIVELWNLLGAASYPGGSKHTLTLGLYSAAVARQ